MAGFMRKTYEKVVQMITGEVLYEIPKASREKDKQEDISQYVVNLWEEARQFRNSAFEKTKETRFNIGEPIRWFEDLARLESGNHWQVWGRRADDGNNRWKQEEVDDEIGNQIRVRAAHINSNWHDISISPNIANITEILDQERRASGWGQSIRGWQKRASIYGDGWLKTILDKTTNPDGVVKEVICENGSIFIAPYATGIEKLDGNWFIQHVTMVNDKQVEADFPDLDINELSTIDGDGMRAIIINRVESARPFSFSHSYMKIDMFIDDVATEEIPYSEAETQIEHATLADAGDINVHRVDNHKEHILAHSAWLQRLAMASPEGNRTPEEQQQFDSLKELMQMHIEDHQKEQERYRRRYGVKSDGKRLKYPSGRHLIVIGGKLAMDQPNEYGGENIDWRDLFHPLKNEDVPNRLDGRGDVETLWNTNKSIDKALSRAADLTVTTSTPKQWFQESDRDVVTRDGLSNDPTEPGFYKAAAPVFRQANQNPGNTDIYNAQKANASRQLGINKSVYGSAPTTQSSSRLAETLIQQSETIIMGETNSNMNDAIEKIIETRIKLWKKFYTEPRFWFINGKIKAINLSKILTFQTIRDDETGQDKEEEIPSFEISVRPNSNYPNKWENQIETLIAARQEIGLPEAQTAIDLLVMDLFAERFPQLSKNGEYYKLGQAFVKGMQVIQQEKAAEEEKQKVNDQIQGKFRSQAIAAVTKQPQLVNGGSVQ